MTTFESDHGDPGGPWNLSKKLRFLDLLMFRARVGVFDPLNIVWGVWNQARNSGNSILIIFLFLKTSNRPLEPKLGQLKVKRLRFGKIVENRQVKDWVQTHFEAFWDERIFSFFSHNLVWYIRICGGKTKKYVVTCLELCQHFGGFFFGKIVENRLVNDWVEIAPILGIFAFGGVPDHGIGIFWYCYCVLLCPCWCLVLF